MGKNYFLDGEDSQNNRSRQGKRRLANYDGCKFDLQDILPDLFVVFENAVRKTNDSLHQFSPTARARNLEPTILQTCFAEELFEQFGYKATHGKHMRIILRTDGYLILFKKLSNNGKPMNIKTKSVQNISNQNQTLSLFGTDVSDYEDEPILHFGYKKNKFNKIVDPQLIYIDEGVVRFSIHQSEIVVPLETIDEDNFPHIPQENIPRIRKSDEK